MARVLLFSIYDADAWKSYEEASGMFIFALLFLLNFLNFLTF